MEIMSTKRERAHDDFPRYPAGSGSMAVVETASRTKTHSSMTNRSYRISQRTMTSIATQDESKEVSDTNADAHAGVAV